MPASFFKECRTTAEAAVLHVVEILYQPLTRPLLTRSFCVVGLTTTLNHNFTFKIPSRCFCLAGMYSAVAPLKTNCNRRVIINLFKKKGTLKNVAYLCRIPRLCTCTYHFYNIGQISSIHISHSKHDSH